MAYYELDPFGSERQDLGAGIVASTIANTSMNRAKGSKTLSPKDFMPDFSGEHRTQPESAEALEAKMMQLAGRYKQ